MSLQVRGGADGIAVFTTHTEKDAVWVAKYLCENCTSFYFEPEPFDERSFYVNGAAGAWLQRQLELAGIKATMRTYK